MTDEEREKWLEGAEYYGDALENRNLAPVMEEGEIDVTVSFPAVKYDKDPSQYSSAKPEGFRQVYFKTFWDKIMEGYNIAVDATEDLVELKESTEAARDGALTATTYAETVNVEVNGMTVSITNRNGQVSTIDVSFDFYKTYSSVAAMNADIANIPNSRLVSIATNDKTSEENARIYQKRSDGTMIYIADLDQSSASAWADWLDSMKPQIEAAIAQAASDHTRSNTDHSTATLDHNTATSDHSTATYDHSIAVGDHNTAMEDHTQHVDDTSIASQDHARAVQDHNTASEDHTTASSDHTISTQDHATASLDHTRAENDHSTATQDHTRADVDHTDVVNAITNANNAANYANSEGDYAKNIGDHPMYIGDGTNGDLNYIYVWYYATQQYIRGPYIKGDDLHWEEMSEQEKQDLASRVLSQLVFATPEETRAMLDELT